MESPISPPIEYPKIYEVNFLLMGTTSNQLDGNTYKSFGNNLIYPVQLYRNTDLLSLLNFLDTTYKNFLNSLIVEIGPFGEVEYDPKNNFISYEDFKDNLDEIRQTSRQGDIIAIIYTFSNRKLNNITSWYIRGFGNNRKIQKLDQYNYPNEWLLPEGSINIINEYNIKNKNDFNKIYPDLGIVGYINNGKYIAFT